MARKPVVNIASEFNDDQDYRGDQNGRPLKSRNSKGWDTFKANHVDQFAYDIELKKRREELEQQRGEESQVIDNRLLPSRQSAASDASLSKELLQNNHTEILFAATFAPGHDSNDVTQEQSQSNNKYSNVDRMGNSTVTASKTYTGFSQLSAPLHNTSEERPSEKGTGPMSSEPNPIEDERTASDIGMEKKKRKKKNQHPDKTKRPRDERPTTSRKDRMRKAPYPCRLSHTRMKEKGQLRTKALKRRKDRRTNTPTNPNETFKDKGTASDKCMEKKKRKKNNQNPDKTKRPRHETPKTSRVPKYRRPSYVPFFGQSSIGDNQRSETSKQTSERNTSTPNSNIFKIASLNVCGLVRRTGISKFKKMVKDHDIVLVSETNLKMCDGHAIYIEGYIYINKPSREKTKRRSRGMGVFIKEQLFPHITIEEPHTDFAIYLKISGNEGEDILVGNVYIPPKKTDSFDKFAEDFDKMIKKTKVPDVYLLGDFNARTGDLRDQTVNLKLGKFKSISVERTNKDKTHNSLGALHLIPFNQRSDMLIMNGRCGQDKGVGETTFKGVSVIDLFLSSIKGCDRIIDFKIGPPDKKFSDGHALLTCKLDFSVNKTPVDQKSYSDHNFLLKHMPFAKEMAHVVFTPQLTIAFKPADNFDDIREYHTTKS